ncbi:MAG: PAS domain S-box protein [Myxococcota bacterium]
MQRPAPHPPPRQTAIRVTVAYLLLASGWMVISELALRQLGSVPLADTLRLLNGLLLVGLTGATLFTLVNRILRNANDAHEQIQDSQLRYAALFHGGEDPVLVFSLDNAGRPSSFTEVNDRACDRLGYTRSALLKKTILDIDGDDGLRKHLPTLLRDGRVLFETFYTDARGSRFPVEVNARGIDLDHRPIIIATVRDQTHRRAAEQALLDSEQRYRLLAENINDLVWTVSREGTLTYLSPSVQRLLGHDPDVLLNDPELQQHIIRDEHLPALMKRVSRLLTYSQAAEPQTERIEVELLCADGTTVWIELELSMLCHPGNQVTGVLGVGRNIQARKRAEFEQRRIQMQLLQAQKMEAVGTLAGGLSHDLNNLLATILGNIELINLNAAPHPLIDKMQGAAQRASALVRKLLLFSRREPHSFHLINLNAAVGEMMEVMDRLLGERITVIAEFNAGRPIISADIGQIEQVLLNLALNARDAMPEGGQLRITTRNITQPTDGSVWVELQFADNGMGMPPEVQQRIFEPFFTTKPIGEGTGLGLSTVYGILKEHGANLDVKSAPDAGTVFTILLPLAHTRVVQDGLSAAIGAPRIANPRADALLLVEDEAAVREFMTHAITEFGYTIHAAGTLAEARALIDAGVPFSALITDVVLPDGSGPQLLVELREVRPSLPALLITGHAGDHIRNHFPDGQRPPLLRKPFTLSELFATLREILSSAETRRSRVG